MRWSSAQQLSSQYIVCNFFSHVSSQASPTKPPHLIRFGARLDDATSTASSLVAGYGGLPAAVVLHAVSADHRWKRHVHQRHVCGRHRLGAQQWYDSKTAEFNELFLALSAELSHVQHEEMVTQRADFKRGTNPPALPEHHRWHLSCVGWLDGHVRVHGD